MRFFKYHVCRADYIVVPGMAAVSVRAICDRHSGVGAAGLVLVGENPFNARFFRPDGREMPLDAGAALCAGAYLCETHGIPRAAIITGAGVAEFDGASRSDLSICLPPFSVVGAKLRRADISMAPEYVKTTFFGSPRAVCPTDDIYGAILFGLGEKMSAYRAFPSGADVDFVKVAQSGEIEVRSYERGAGYVVSCTGALAAAAVMSSLGRCSGTVYIRTDSGRMRVSLGERATISATVSKVMTGDTF